MASGLEFLTGDKYRKLAIAESSMQDDFQFLLDHYQGVIRKVVRTNNLKVMANLAKQTAKALVNVERATENLEEKLTILSDKELPFAEFFIGVAQFEEERYMPALVAFKKAKDVNSAVNLWLASTLR